MTSLVNQVQLIGRLGADAEIKTTNQGTKIGTFRLAINEPIKQENGTWKENTLWHNCVVWGEQNKVIEKYGKKGAQLCIQGSLNYREYTDSSGNKKNATEIRVDRILVLNSDSKQESKK